MRTKGAGGGRLTAFTARPFETKIDVAVAVAVFVDSGRAPSTPYGYASELGSELMRALGTSRVDLVVLNGAPPLLYHRVLRDGLRVLSRDLAATTTREGRALSRYCDYVPQLAKIERAAAARIRAGAFGR